MTTEYRDDGETRKLLRYLDLVLDPQVGQEAAVDNLAAKPLEKLGYDDGEGIDHFYPTRTSSRYLRNSLGGRLQHG
jgi:hypothetical protein